MTPVDCKEDSAVVKKLKQAGAIIVTRGNSSEFLLGRETDNLVYGTTNNALNQKLTAGGSSGGDAVLVGSESVVFGIGTDIGGSCRYPAAFNGIVGFKPASGQIDKQGIFPAAGNDFVETMNSPGILCRSVRDVRLVYNVISNKHIGETKNLSNTKILKAKNFQVTVKDDSITNSLNESFEFLRRNNFSVQDIDIPESGKLYLMFATLMCGGFTDKIYEWSKTVDGKKLTFMGEWLRRRKGRPTISSELFSMLLPFNLMKPSASKLQKTIDAVQQLRNKYNSLLGENGILILPTVGVLAPEHKKFVPQYNKPGVIRIITPISLCNILNLSCITVPAKKYRADKTKNPPAVQLVSKSGSEELLLSVAEKLEQHFNS
jgi:Asp-tRNA(Asn)/Glu-tRNA(Gln) amidotransferase A subunit family amidase